MKLADRMLAKVGKTQADLPKNSKLGRILRRRGVGPSRCLSRVVLLPRRDWRDGAAELSKLLTAELREAGGTLSLRPVQAAALAELHDRGGLLAPARVGAGKTIISLLAGEVVGAKRPLLLVPARLRAKTWRDADEARRHFRFTRPLLLSYEMLSGADHVDDLETMRPDLIISDECHRLKNKRAACTRRVARYMAAHPETRFVAMSGTITTRSLKDYAHLLEWALGAGSPLPTEWPALEEWCAAVDVEVEDDARLAPGALEALGVIEDADPLGSARRAVRARVTETAGVVATEESALGMSLSVVAVPAAWHVDIADALRTMRRTWETPDGHPFTEAVDLWRHAREIACGFYYVWDPRPPAPWLDARRAWAKFVRETLRGNRRGLDTELQVARACPDAPELLAWQAVRDSFKPSTRPEWISDVVLRQCADWLYARDGFCWVEHVAFGEALAELTGLRYFGAGGVSSGGIAIEDAHGSVIASIGSCSEGRNLQRWSRNLVASPPANGKTWEQMVGRTHRDGQLADEVTVEVLIGCTEAGEGLAQAFRDARFVLATTGQEQKLLVADVEVAEVAELFGVHWNAPRDGA